MKIRIEEARDLVPDLEVLRGEVIDRKEINPKKSNLFFIYH